MKRQFYCLLACVVAMTLLLCGCSKPLNSSCTVDGLQQNVQGERSYIRTKTGDTYMKMYGSDEFADLWRLDEWVLSEDEPSADEPMISLCFAELYIAELYEGGQAAVYYGYALRGEQPYAYYTVPTEVAAAVAEYVQAFAQPCEPGDANASTFVPSFVNVF